MVSMAYRVLEGTCLGRYGIDLLFCWLLLLKLLLFLCHTNERLFTGSVMIVRKGIVSNIAIVVAAAVVALFFTLFYPYHLFHREQYSLFLMNSEFVHQIVENGSFASDAWLSTLLGGFLTQFYYYIYAGPIVIGLVVLGIGLLCFRLLSRMGLDWRWALAVSLVFMFWEAGRECVNEYPLASSISLLLGFAMGCAFPLRARVWVKVACLVLMIAFGVWAVGYGTVVVVAVALSCFMRAEFATLAMSVSVVIAAAHWGFMLTSWYGFPNMYVERLFEIDTKYNRGVEIGDVSSSDELKTSQIGNYYNMLSAVSNKADDAIGDLQWQTMTPFLPVDPSGNYFSITMAGNVWFELGDMTMAEHAAILGMIFSPYNQGTRHLRRLAEINIINGDEAAAQKYLNMLNQTIPHKAWARARMTNNRTDSFVSWLEMKRMFIPKGDTLRSSADYHRSLCNLLDANVNNRLARVYLFAYDLKNKNLGTFADDYLKYGNGSMCRTYAEALLVAMVNAPEDKKSQLMKVHIPSSVLSEFSDFNKLYQAQDMTSLKLKYRDTYWFYCKFVK